MDVAGQLQRIAEATLAIERRLATRLVSFAAGTAYLDDDYPLRYDANYLLVEGPGPGDATSLDAEAGRILGGAGLRHREVVVPDDDRGAALSRGFAGLGYQAEHALVMLHDGSSSDAVAASAEPVTFEEFRPFLIEVGRRAPWFDGDDRVVEMLADYRGKLERTIGCSFVAARADGRIVSGCELYLEGDVAQVEDVNTLEGFRNRGLATACVVRAIEIAHERGADVVFLEADVHDWPQELYRRLGFLEADRSWTFVQTPGAGRPAPVHDGR